MEFVSRGIRLVSLVQSEREIGKEESGVHPFRIFTLPHSNRDVLSQLLVIYSLSQNLLLLLVSFPFLHMPQQLVRLERRHE